MGNKVTVMFPAGAETIEIVGTHVVPEFGTIAAMILAVAIVSISNYFNNCSICKIKT